jgi:transglutaminase-like putative cysteine protease
MMEELLEPTGLLDFNEPSLRGLIVEREWGRLAAYEKIDAIYEFVRDGLAFGYNEDDSIPASRVLADGYGQCNTKGILFMALLRGVGVRCRLHGFTIRKELQKGAIDGIWYRLAPKEIVHSWVELEFEGRWIDMEGFIVDTPYLRKVQAMVPTSRGGFCGYGIATDRIEAPAIEWTGKPTYIQKDGIERDFGVFPSPDAFLAAHAQPMGRLKRFVFRAMARGAMNAKIARIRRGGAS